MGQESYVAADRKAVGPLRNLAGIDFADNPQTGVGQNLVLNFTLNLPPQVVAVDPQPIVDQTTLTVKTVSGNGGLTNGNVLTLNAVAVPSTGVTPVTEPTALQFSTTGVNGTLIPGTNNICVSFSSTMTPAQVAQNLSQAIEAAGTDLIASASFNVVTIESSALGVDRTKMASPNAITVGVLPQAQLRNTVDVYFTDNDPLNPASATDTNFYQLINTKGSADDTKDAVYTPMSAYYDPNLNRVRLTFNAPAGDLASLGSGAFPPPRGRCLRG